jgi:hypothetical protein
MGWGRLHTSLRKSCEINQGRVVYGSPSRPARGNKNLNTSSSRTSQSCASGTRHLMLHVACACVHVCVCVCVCVCVGQSNLCV